MQGIGYSIMSLSPEVRLKPTHSLDSYQVTFFAAHDGG